MYMGKGKNLIYICFNFFITQVNDSPDLWVNDS